MLLFYFNKNVCLVFYVKKNFYEQNRGYLKLLLNELNEYNFFRNMYLLLVFEILFFMKYDEWGGGDDNVKMKIYFCVKDCCFFL